uniref:Cytochrome c biogenesis protein CcsA n=1 Tax=Phacotus lenticularis TaxID=52965 RepID=A0A0S2LQV2_9CHLO|nr:heme attachment to plastid cytochrome c [Phacotus lenticularis]ALO63571.1 heme attachment to plastid cytochrome c [Phacotus lenticularis]
MFTPLENFLSNFSFLTLFLSMLIYWVEISNFTLVTPSLRVKQNPTLVGSMGSSVNSIAKSEVNNWNTNLSKSPGGATNKNYGQIGVLISNLSIFILLVLRWKESGHFPLSNLYESLMFLSWTLTTIHLFLEFNIFGLNIGTTPFMAKLIGSITTPSALFTNAFATFSLPKEMQEASPLVPALQSNWLMMHVTVMILSYGALICGSLLAIAFLIITGLNKNSSNVFTQNNINEEDSEINNRTQNQNTLDLKNKEVINSSDKKIQKLAMTFDNLSYRILGIGFPLLTIGILSGAVWANEAWGSYWSWDPKETWALLTWLVFAIYLHTRLNKGWQGKKPALIASLGFVSVWICYLGVNLLGEGLHSYGWFQ